MTQKTKKKRHRYWRRNSTTRRRGDFDRVLDRACRRLRKTNPSAARLISDYRRQSRLPHATERLLLHRSRVERGDEALHELAASLVSVPVRALAGCDHLDQDFEDMTQEAIADMIAYLGNIDIGRRSQWMTLVSFVPRNARVRHAIEMATQTRLPRDGARSSILAKLTDLDRHDLEELDDFDLNRICPKADDALVNEACAALTSETSVAAPEASHDPRQLLERGVDLGRVIDWARGHLSAREWTIFSMKYLQEADHSLQEIGDLLGITAERVRQIDRDTLQILAEAYASDLQPPARKSSR